MRTTFCLNHEDVPAVGYCTHCHKPICENCTVRSGDTIFCSEVCRDRFVGFHARWKEKSPRKRGLIYRFILLVLTLAVFWLSIKIGVWRGVPFFVRINEVLFGSAGSGGRL